MIVVGRKAALGRADRNFDIILRGLSELARLGT